MNLTKKFSYSTITFTVFFASCFFKSDKNGTADDVKQSFICHTANGDYILTHEEVYHATSKSYNNGISMTTGYADYRYTIRELKTGNQISRAVTDDAEHDVLTLGYDGTNLWCYSADKSLGLHARNPSSMIVTVTQKQVESANPELAGKISSPQWNEAGQYYSYDYLTNHVMLTSQTGILYSMDPQTLKATVITEKPEDLSYSDDATSTTGELWQDRDISMRGDIRQHVEVDDHTESHDTFLKGEILMEMNNARLGLLAQQWQQQKYDAIKRLRYQRDSLLITFPLLKDERTAYSTYRDYKIPDAYYNLTRDLEDMERDSANGIHEITSSLSRMTLGCDTNTIYILHANDLSDTSSIVISKVSLHGKEFTTQWSTLIPHIYFDPDKGIKQNPMGDVFKSGSPEFGYEWYGLEGDVLCGVKMLFAFALDTETGKLLWKQQL